MKVIAVNGSPRKNWNTSTLLQKAIDGAASIGAQTELIHLYDLDFKGCTSCFRCKRQGTSHPGRCGMKDGLTDVLEKILECEGLILGSPIYFGNITGEMRSFLERLMFSNLSYNAGRAPVFNGRISSGFIYTMNVGKSLMVQYSYDTIFKYYQSLLQRVLMGNSEYLTSNDTFQFDDYSNYEVSMFDAGHKLKVREEVFPVDCRKAFDMGVRIAK